MGKAVKLSGYLRYEPIFDIPLLEWKSFSVSLTRIRTISGSGCLEIGDSSQAFIAINYTKRTILSHILT